MKGLSVKDVTTFGYETFPNARRDWPGVTIQTSQLTREWHDIMDWLDQNINRSDWTRDGNRFLFTNESDAILFRLTWK